MAGQTIGVRVEKLQQVFGALNGAEVRYLVVGGIAVIAHGYQRLTSDIDLVVQLLPDNVRRAMAALTALGYKPKVPVDAERLADPTTRARWIAEKGMLVFQMASDEFRWEPIDIFVNEPFPFDAVFSKAKWHNLDGHLRIPIVPLEELLVMKQAAGRPTDLTDIDELRDYRVFEDEHNERPKN